MSRPAPRSRSSSFSPRWVPFWPPSAAGATRARRRRVSGPIIVISIDTLRADHLPAYGYAQGEDAGDRRARGRRRRVRARLFARAADAAGARGAAVRAAAVRDRRARQRRLRGEAGRAAAAADAARARLRDRRRRVGVRAAEGNRHRPGLRFLRRRDAAELAGAVRSARCSATARESETIAEHWLDTIGTVARLSVPASLRAAQAVRAAGALRRNTRRTTARSRTRTKSSAG